MQGPTMVIIGRVLGAHGVRGEIKVLPLTDFPERFFGMKRLEVFRPAGRLIASLTVRSLRFHEAKGLFLVETGEIGDRDGAEDLKDGVVMIKASERVPLPKGSFWVDDVVGLRVVSADTGEEIGKVEAVLQTGAHDVYSVRTPQGEVRMMPAVREVVLRILPEEGIMEVRPLEGLWD
ncbi:MAG TPA: ribosome maturation factor RimM [Synergistales bacterium]|nr:ribosome maturation factor RimM [Synergistales bacterium]